MRQHFSVNVCRKSFFKSLHSGRLNNESLNTIFCCWKPTSHLLFEVVVMWMLFLLYLFEISRHRVLVEKLKLNKSWLNEASHSVWENWLSLKENHGIHNIQILYYSLKTRSHSLILTMARVGYGKSQSPIKKGFIQYNTQGRKPFLMIH